MKLRTRWWVLSCCLVAVTAMRPASTQPDLPLAGGDDKIDAALNGAGLIGQLR